jgi:thiol-disulfide isomerase/thioredoxin
MRRTHATFSSLRSAALALVLLALAGGAAALESGDAAPGFTAPVLNHPVLEDGAPLSLESYRGKVIYLDFWASWCAPCAVSLPILDALGDEFGPDRFQVLAVNVDRDTRRAEDFLAKRPVGYPSVTDPKGQLPVRFGVETMPTSFLIDQEGVIRHVHRGFRKGDEEALRHRILELMGGRR